MKKALSILAVSSLLAVNPALSSESKNLEYKWSGSAQVGGTVTLTGLLLIAGGFTTASDFVARTGMGGAVAGTYGMIAVQAGSVIGGVGLLTLAYGSFKGLKKVDQEKYMKDYAKLRSILTASLLTGTVGANTEVHRLISNFQCSSCDSDAQKIQKFALVFKKVDELAETLVTGPSFSKDGLEEAVDSEEVTQNLLHILGSDAQSIANQRIVKKLLVLALVNSLILNS